MAKATVSSKFPMTVTVLRTMGGPMESATDYVLRDVTDVYDLLSRQPKVENGVIVEAGVTNLFCPQCQDFGEWCPNLSFAYPTGFQPLYGCVGDVLEEVYPV